MDPKTLNPKGHVTFTCTYLDDHRQTCSKSVPESARPTYTIKTTCVSEKQPDCSFTTVDGTCKTPVLSKTFSNANHLYEVTDAHDNNIKYVVRCVLADYLGWGYTQADPNSCFVLNELDPDYQTAMLDTCKTTYNNMELCMAPGMADMGCENIGKAGAFDCSDLVSS